MICINITIMQKRPKFMHQRLDLLSRVKDPMTVMCKCLGVALCLCVSFDISTSRNPPREFQLQGHPVPYKNVEKTIQETLSKQCSRGEYGRSRPNISVVEWEYHNEIRTISSPFSHIPKKTSSLLLQWKRYLNESAYRNGWSEHDPYINTGGLRLPNVFDHFRMNGASPCRDIDLVIRQKDKFGQRYNRVYRQTDVIEVIKVSKHHRIPLLDGQFALRAKMNIPQNTVLGRFCGDEMYSFEYDKVYMGTCEIKMRDDYRMTLGCPMNVFNETELCPIEGSDGDIIVDELTTFPANPLVFTNDPRKDLYNGNTNVTADDDKFWNARFERILVNGWPYVVIINHKKIRKGEEIAIYYGKKYVAPPNAVFRSLKKGFMKMFFEAFLKIVAHFF